jgi:hypothetical protein
MLIPRSLTPHLDDFSKWNSRFTMKRTSFSLPPSAIRLSRRFAFAGACALILATTSEPTLADPPSVQSNEMAAVSVDSDRAEPGTANSNRLVRPHRVESTSGQVSNAQALVAGHHGFATLTWGGTGSAPMIVLDYGRDVGGIPLFDIVSVSNGTPTLRVIYSEGQPYLLPSGDGAAPSGG